MSEEYRIHFGFSKRSKFYPQAVELAALAPRHETRGEGEDRWHIVSLTEANIELLHRLYLVARKLPRPKVYGADALCLSFAAEGPRPPWNGLPLFARTKRVQNALERIQRATGKSGSNLAQFIREEYVEPVNRDALVVSEKLRAIGRLDRLDRTSLEVVPATCPIPDEPVGAIREMRALVSAGRLEDAIAAYYANLGKKFYGELTGELIYLKRLAGVPLAGRDLLIFRSESSCDDFLRQHLHEYVHCVDLALTQCERVRQPQPLQLLMQHAPTMEQMIEERHKDWNFAAYLKRHLGKLLDLRFKNKLPLTASDVLTGIFQLLGRHDLPIYGEQDSKMELLLDIPRLASCREWGRIRLEEWLCSRGAERVEALAETWREGKAQPTAHPFCIGVVGAPDSPRNMTEWNCLMADALRWLQSRWKREIGSSPWITENQLYQILRRLLKGMEVIQHARPKWLEPQHLDVYVPQAGIAVEYMGKQHFEPLDFFGGETAFQMVIERDRRKAELCKNHGVELIRVRFDEDVGIRAKEIANQIKPA